MTISLDRIIDANVTRATRVASRRSFGTTAIVAYHSVFPERIKAYSEPSEMVDDGFGLLDAAYLDAVALCSQEGRPRIFKIGRRASAPTQSVKLTPSAPTEGEVYSVTIGGVTFSVTAGAGEDVEDICDALDAIMTADTDAVATTLASAAAAQVFDVDDFDGVLGGTLAPPRNVTLTLNAHADWTGGTIVVTGRDADGRVITESYTVPVGGDDTLVGAQVFSRVTQIDVPGQDGANGTIDVGVGVVFANAGLDFTPTDNATDVDIDADTAGDWYAFADATANLALDDQTTDPGIAADLTAIRAADADWYGLVIADAQSAAQIEAAAGWAATEKIVYMPHTLDTDVEGAVDTDVVSTLRDSSRYRTVPFYSRRNAGRGPAAALFGRVLGLPPGSWTAAFKTLEGLTADSLSTNAVELILGAPNSPVSGKGGIIYAEVLPSGTNVGTSVTLGGLSGGAEWLDVIQGIDFTVALIQERSWNILISSAKVGFTEAGIDRLTGAVRGALRTAARAPYGVLDEATIEVEPVLLEDVSVADRQARHYDGVRWDARVQGAIHSAKISGTVRP